MRRIRQPQNSECNDQRYHTECCIEILPHDAYPLLCRLISIPSFPLRSIIFSRHCLFNDFLLRVRLAMGCGVLPALLCIPAFLLECAGLEGSAWKAVSHLPNFQN